MTTAFSDSGTHPVMAAVAQITEILDHLDPTYWSMSHADLAATLPALSRLRTRVTGLELGVAHAADTIGLGTEIGAADTGAYWANTTRQPKGTAKHRLALANALDQHPVTQAAMAAGAVAEDQATVIVRCVEGLPVMRGEAESYLIAQAAEHDAKTLAILGKKVLEVVAPELAEEHLAKELEREEQRALEDCRLTITGDGHGVSTIRGKVPTVVGAMFRKQMLAFNAPKVRAKTLSPAGLGHAFCEYVTRYPADSLPQAGGVNATLVVNLTLQTLTGNAPATLETGQPISASSARKLACEAGIVPMVLSGKSVVLDHGSKRRLFSEAQHLALNVRDHGCTALGCDWPAWLCHAHHDLPWSHGGKTDLANARLLCPRHHSYAHDPTYEMKKTKHGQVSFLRQ